MSAKTRKLLTSSYVEGQESLSAMNRRGDLLVAAGLPPKAELVRLGNTFSCQIATGSAFTYVNAWPTTRAELVIYNGEPGGGKCYVFDSAFMVDITSAAAAHAKALLAQLIPVATAPTDSTSQLITSRSGLAPYGASYPGRAKRDVANTAAGAIANRWELIGGAINPNTASIGTPILAELYGGWIVPPGGALALAGVASTAAGTAIIGVCWHEVQLDL